MRAELEFDVIRKGLLKATNFDIGRYRPQQMLRLFATIMAKERARDFPEYIRLLKDNPERIRRFKKQITIHVSDFFRDKRLFDFLDKTILPRLLSENSRLHIWCAGCSGGEEPYSVAMLLEEQKRIHAMDYQILATDINEDVCDSARLGFYPEKALKNVPPQLRNFYFEADGENFQIVRAIRRKVRFETQDVLKPFGRKHLFQLILCRNTIIYFSEKFKPQIYRNLIEALAPGGILFTGGTENLLNYADFGVEKLETCFYRKTSETTRRRQD